MYKESLTMSSRESEARATQRSGTTVGGCEEATGPEQRASLAVPGVSCLGSLIRLK